MHWRKAATTRWVSTSGQTTESQERELRAIAEKAGWEIVNVYRDAGISGAKGRDQRPAFDALYKDAARRRFDMLAATKRARIIGAAPCREIPLKPERAPSSPSQRNDV